MNLRGILKRFFPGGSTEFDVSFSPFTSSNVSDIRYSTEDKLLEITFNNGSTYRYIDVPESVVEELESTDSKGRFIAANIKNKYRFRKV